MRPSDEKIIFGSTRKFQKDTGWKPIRSIEQTLAFDVGILGSGIVVDAAASPCPNNVVKDPMSDVTAVLLVGGMGTRLRSLLPSTPKATGIDWKPIVSGIAGSAAPFSGIPPFGDVYGLSRGPDRG